MNIQVTNLDLGYTQCEELNTLSVQKGETLISNLNTNITNLKNHWKGSDANTHINNLISVYNSLVALVTDAKKVTSAAGSAISAIQEVRRANGGSGNVGALLPNNAPDAGTIQAPAETTEYYCDPSAATDHSTLEQICTDFETFKNNFNTQKTELMSNWTAGAGREKAVECFNGFEENSETYKTYLNGARDNLGIAVSNIAKLG